MSDHRCKPPTEHYLGYWECECGTNRVQFHPHEYDAGTLRVGQRIRLNARAVAVRHVGAVGTVVKVERKLSPKVDQGAFSHTMPFPVVVWLDIFGNPTPAERANGLGLPVCASEVDVL